MRERPKDVTGFKAASRSQGETFEADHRIASPIREPMVASDDSAHFVTGGVRSSRFFKSPRRRDDELIGGKNQFGGDTILSFRLSLDNKTRPAFALSREHVCWA